MILFRSWLSVLVVTCASLSAWPSAAADDIPRQARALFAEGRTAMMKKDWPAAERAFSEAWRIHRSYDIAALLSQAEEKNGHIGQAAEHIDYSVRHFPPKDADLEAHQRIRDAFRRLRAQLVEVEVNVDRIGAEVYVDDQLRGKTPLDGHLFLTPGRHRVDARRGDLYMSQVVNAEAGESRRIALVLEVPRSEAAEETAMSETDPAVQPGGSTSEKSLSLPASEQSAHPERLPLLVTGGVLAAAAVGLGAYFGVVSADKEDSRAVLASQLPDSACAGAVENAAQCEEIRSLDAERRKARDVSVGLFISGGALAVTTAIYAVFSRKRGPSGPTAGQAVIAPVADRGFIGAAARIAF